jgi:hypothetical protein
MKKMKRFSIHRSHLITFFIGVMSLVVIVAAFIVFSSRSSNISDEARMQDLQLIETALVKSDNDQIPSERKMPTKLSELNIVGLQGKLAEYEYKDYKAGYQGSSYTLCAKFRQQGEKKLNDYFTGSGIEVYNIHNKGKTCFNNSIYKGSSHIRTL